MSQLDFEPRPQRTGRNHEALNEEIKALERRLDDARALRDETPPLEDLSRAPGNSMSNAAFHNILVLADSALPLGSFAFSSGLESFMAHTPGPPHQKGLASFRSFLTLSLASIASAILPYVANAYSSPKDLQRLDNDLDASTACTVAKRASVAQGRALLAMWDRSLKAQYSLTGHDESLARIALQDFSNLIKDMDMRDTKSTDGFDCSARGHLPPMFGVLCNVMGLTLRETLYLHLLNHCKTLLSAGIRASLFGPYQSQALLMSEWLRGSIDSLVEIEITSPRRTDEAGQSVPVLDIWGGRHDLLYSRIFNS